MRKSFTTTIDDRIQDDFKEACKKNDIKMNDALEALMQAYTNNQFKIETSYNVQVVANEKD